MYRFFAVVTYKKSEHLTSFKKNMSLHSFSAIFVLCWGSRKRLETSGGESMLNLINDMTYLVFHSRISMNTLTEAMSFLPCCV